MGSNNKESSQRKPELSMNNDLVSLSSLVTATLLGVVVAGILNYYVMKLQDERRFKHENEKKKDLDDKRKATAYRRLKSLTDRIVWQNQGATSISKYLSEAELESIELTIAQNYDVLDQTTIAAWDTKGISRTGQGPESTSWVLLTFESFIVDVNKHYDALKFKAIPPSN